jgi:hypothetical protein
VFCVLTQFHRHLKRRDVYAEASARWRDPRAHLLAGAAWAVAKDTVLAALDLPEDAAAAGPAGLAGRLDDHAQLLDGAYREVGARLAANANPAVTVDTDGRLHVERLAAIPEPPSLVDLRRRVHAMLPRSTCPRSSWR